MRGYGLMGALAVLAGFAATARGNLLINGAMESAIPPVQPDNLVYVTPSTNSTALTGWTLDSGEIDIVPSSYFQSSQGSYSVDMAGTPGLGSISQSFATTASLVYILTFDFSINPERGPVNERSLVKTLRIEAIGADGVTVLESEDYTGTRGTRTNTNMQWSQQTFTFTADGSVATLRLRAIAPTGHSPGSLFTGPVIDNLDLIEGGGGVPEPASLSILGLAATALLLPRRRR